MIKFFRHIRKSLLMENKTGKYFKYAIGEIVLVVIGILIALSINNWNEQRKLSIEEKQSLQQILKDLKQEMSVLIDDNTDINKRNTYLQKVSRGKFDQINLDSLILNLDTYYYFSKSNTAYSGLKDSGKFSAISNISLKDQIVYYYEIVYDQLKSNSEYAATYTNDQVAPFITTNLHFGYDLITNSETVKQKLKTTNLLSIINYQINVNEFISNNVSDAIKTNIKLENAIEQNLKNSQ